MQLGLVAGRQHHLFQWAMTSSGTETAPLAVQCALQSHCWWLYLTSSVKPCNRVSNATAQQRKSGKKLMRSSLCAYTPCQPSHTNTLTVAATALHAQQASKGEKHFISPLPLCIFLLKYTHSQAQRGEECLALLQWLSGRSTAPFSGNSTRVLEQLFQFLIQALETEDQVTFLSSHQH